MRSESGRYVIVFNGEIYNFAELRRELEAEARPVWRGHSDTEIMLAAFECWGVERSLRQFVGMFAFALWDAREHVLHLVRDRLGEKPLYYGWAGEVLLFGSELKALHAHPEFQTAIDRDALALLMRYGCVPAPYSIYAGTQKLLPGTWLSLTQEAFLARRRASVQPYWTLAGAVTDGVRLASKARPKEIVNELDRLLRGAVAGQMVADVPLGAFLSGGVDSSTVVALMQAQSERPVRTFTIGFAEAEYNEAQHAERVARHLGTDHTELYVTPQDALDVVPRLTSMYDEPFADSSQIPTFLVSQLARQQVTVSLSGDGGDELFGGYNRHHWGKMLRRQLGWMPHALRDRLAKSLTRRSPAAWDAAFDRLSWAVPGSLRYKAPGDKLHKVARLLTAGSDEELYQRMVSFWPDGVAIREAGYPVPPGWIAYGTPSALRTLPERMMYLDALGYLPDDILVKVDRAAMSVSLETRVPLLDHRVVEFAWRLPLRYRVRGGQGKWLLRQVLYRYVPRALVDRPKQGFGIPIDTWLRGPLREWAEALLCEQTLAEQGLLDPAPIRRIWTEHLSGRQNWQHHLWIVLSFQAWLARWGGRAGA
jgi:asparagine synthase (glutamine-hydrolysing)